MEPNDLALLILDKLEEYKKLSDNASESSRDWKKFRQFLEELDGLIVEKTAEQERKDLGV